MTTAGVHSLSEPESLQATRAAQIPAALVALAQQQLKAYLQSQPHAKRHSKSYSKSHSKPSQQLLPTSRHNLEPTVNAPGSVQPLGSPAIQQLYQFQLATTPQIYWVNVGPSGAWQGLSLTTMLIMPATDFFIDRQTQSVDPLLGAYASLQHLQVLLERQRWQAEQ
ncbi:MAG: hypothetical protein AAGF24_16140 [Cyanobacteria bacterium P01_H01_bin.121]